MTDLVACLSTGKGTWTNVLRLVKKEEFENIYLIANNWAKENLKLERKNLHMVVVNSNDSTKTIQGEIENELKGKIKDFEVAVNIDSGSGKEHTAIITALMKLGLALRFVGFENEDWIRVKPERAKNWPKGFRIPARLKEVDHIISVPVLHTHSSIFV